MRSPHRSKSKPRPRPDEGGRLKIGDDWNAIRIIALSQGNPLKAIAEFVENSIDANAKSVTITRGRIFEARQSRVLEPFEFFRIRRLGRERLTRAG